MLVQQVLHAVDAETFALGAGKEHVAISALRLAQPGFQDGERGLGDRRTAFLATLANDAHVSAGSEDEVVTFEPGHLRQT